MKKVGIVLFAMGFIVFAIFGGMATAYLLGGFLDFKVGNHIPSMVLNLVILMLTFVMVIATMLTLAERKWSALMQDRIGPNRARLSIIPVLGKMPLAGLPHVATDVLKMLTKEDFQPQAANKFLFNLAPILAFAPVFCLFAIVPVGPALEVVVPMVSMTATQVSLVVANPDFGLLFIFAIASLAVYGTSLAGWASNNKFALLGGVRASSQMISYEVALGLSLVGMMIAFSTVRLAGADGMVEMQGRYLWQFTGADGGFDIGVPQWGILLQPAGFILFFAAAFAETKRAPFDVPEGESEIIGYFVEYSGMKFGLFMISEFVEVVVLSGVLAAIFFGGWHIGIGDQWLSHKLAGQQWLLGSILATVFWIKVILLCYLQLLIRWTFPRFRYDQIQTLGWKILLPVGLINLFVTGALILWDPSLRMLGIVGALEIFIVFALTLTSHAPAKSDAHGHDAHGHGAAAAAHH